MSSYVLNLNEKNKFSEATKSKSTSFSNQTDGNNESSYMSAEDMAGDLHRGLDDLTNLPSENGVLHPGDVSDLINISSLCIISTFP